MLLSVPENRNTCSSWKRRFKLFLRHFELPHDPHLIVLLSDIERGVTIVVASVDISEILGPKELGDEFVVAVLCRVMESNVARPVCCIDVFSQYLRGNSRFLILVGPVRSEVGVNINQGVETVSETSLGGPVQRQLSLEVSLKHDFI